MNDAHKSRRLRLPRLSWRTRRLRAGATGVLFYAVATAGVVVVVLVVAAFVFPLVRAFAPAFADGASGAGEFRRVIRPLAYTFKIAIGSTLVAFAVGMPTAFFTARRRFLGKNVLLSLSAVPLCVPPLIIALGFVSVFGMNGAINNALARLFRLDSPPLAFLYSQAGVVIAQGFYNFSLVMRIVSDAWAGLSSERQDAAMLLGAGSSRVFFTITLSALAPAIAAACIPVFLYCFFSFMIVLLFGTVGGSTLEVEIYQAARVALDFKSASLLALVETFCAMAVVFAYGKIGGNTAGTARLNAARGGGSSRFSDTAPNIAGGLYESRGEKLFERIFAFVLFALIALFFLAPLAGIFAGGVSSKDGAAIFFNIVRQRGFLAALRGTISTALPTAFFCVLCAFTYAAFLRLRRFQKRRAIFETLPMLPMAVSSVVMGYGMTLVFRRATVFSLVAAQVSLIWPLAFRQLYASLSAIPDETISAARLLSKNPLDKIFRVLIPQSAPSIVSAFGFCLAASAGDATLPLVLSVPRFDTLSLYTYRLASAYRFEASCACGALLCLLCVLFFAIGTGAKRRRLRAGDY